MYTLLAARVSRKGLVDRTVSLALLHLHNHSLVAAPITVVRCTPHSHQVPPLEPCLVSRLHQLMRSDDQPQPVMMVELISRTTPEQPAHSSAAHHPPLDLIWIRPDQIPETPRRRDLCYSIDVVNFIQSVDLRRETSMETEDVICDRQRGTVDEGRKWQVIEDLVA